MEHLHHNVMKCKADMMCPRADYIMHIDSDCMFREPVSPEDYFIDGKPVLLIESYDHIKASGHTVPWQKVVEETLRRPSQWECMRRQPIVHCREAYPMTRNLVTAVQGINFDQFVLSRKPNYPSGFCEFNTIGDVVLNSPLRTRYHLIDVGREPYPHNKMIQFWSHGGIHAKQNIWIDGVLTELTPVDVMEEILKR